MNGHKLQQVIFPVVAMSDWNTWGTVSYRVPLVCGSNSVMLKYDSGDSGNINIDALTLVPKSASWLQAENAVLSGGVQINCNHSGYVGTGFTDSWSTAGAKHHLLRIVKRQDIMISLSAMQMARQVAGH